MNKRIDQIADQVMSEFGNEFKDRDSGIVVSDEFFERFAELIVKECIGIVGHGGEFASRPKLIEKLQEHFGVE